MLMRTFLFDANNIRIILNGRTIINNGFLIQATISIPILNVKEFLTLWSSFASLVAMIMLGSDTSSDLSFKLIPPLFSDPRVIFKIYNADSLIKALISEASLIAPFSNLAV